MDETSTIKAPHPQNGDGPSHENRLRPEPSSGAAEVGREGREKGRVGPGRSRRLLKVLRLLAGTAILAAILAAAGAAWLVWRMRASLPRLQGEVEVFGLQGSVRILRDDLGIPTLKAAGLEDLAYATGFVHAQDRFFQMDLQRRVAAGELAELVGSLGLRLDRRVRIHRLRARAREMVAALPTFQRHVLQAYARGVAAGRHSLGAPPPEYLLLRARPVPWKSEDSLLVILSMFLDLQDASGWYESRMGLMHDLLPPSLFRFLTPQGTEWDAPVQGKALSLPQIPPADEVDIRTMEPWRILRSKVSSGLIPGLRVGGVGTGGRPHLWATVFQADPSFMAGSNNWAVAAAHTAAGGALLANDMHLALRLPNTWYRARLIWRPAGAAEDAQVTGATLPGVPGVVVGSNGHVAWGFTNSYADWSDLVVIQLDPDHPDSYLTPAGPRRFQHRKAILKLNSCVARIFCDGIVPAETLDVVSTIWGPIIDHDHRGRPRAIRWVGHDTAAVNLNIWKMATARTVEEAMAVAHVSGIPGQNCTVADENGRIGWTIMGILPRRVGFDGRLPVSWADGTRSWDGWLDPGEVPEIIQPASGRIWTANARVVDEAGLAILGDGGYALGARARQIRDDLHALEKATEEEMLAVQLDDRAHYLSRWREFLLHLLTPEALQDRPQRREFRRLVDETWTGRASVDSVSFRLVRAFRRKASAVIFAILTTPVRKEAPGFKYVGRQGEGPLWELVTRRPENLLHPAFDSWEALLLRIVDATVEELLAGKDIKLADLTWGRRNTVRVNHPLGMALPFLGRWLNAPEEQLPGAGNMPRFQAVDGGASERMVVSPGHEEKGLFHMPGGQSGHFLSPHYLDGHRAWAEGKPTPFLPGPVRQTLILKPRTD